MISSRAARGELEPRLGGIHPLSEVRRAYVRDDAAVRRERHGALVEDAPARHLEHDDDPFAADPAAALGAGVSPERAPTALNSFFRTENLAALRDVALREVAEEVESPPHR
jgi:hypothetical protein